MPDCVFCSIIHGSTDATIVFEDDISIAFLDARPLFPGHTLLVPRHHHQTLTDLPADLVPQLFKNARLLAAAVEKAMEAQGTFVAMNNRVSQSVPHLHIHIVPRRKKDGLRGFFWPRHNYQSEAHIMETREAIREAVQEMLQQEEE